MDIVIAMVAKIGEYMVKPIGQQLGYFFFYNNKVTKLRKQVKSLEEKNLRVQRCVDEATWKGDEIQEDVKNWLIEVADKLKDVKKSTDEDECQEVADKSCSNWSCPNLKLQYQRSRKAYKMAQLVPELEELEMKGSSLEGKVSYRVPIKGIGTEAIKGYVVFGSRNSTLIGVIEALKSDNVSKIGVYGMGGAGKTMLVKEVARQAEQNQLFDKVVVAVVSQTPNIKEIQRVIFDKIDLQFDPKESIEGRADRLRKRLNKEKKILVIIDDIWGELELEAVGISFGDDQKGCKLLFTSRCVDVLRNNMDCQEVFSLGVLLNDEAKNLFGKIVGGLPEDKDFHAVADEVVQECAGLPIAITTVASAVKNKSLPVWKDAVQQLQKSNLTNIKGMDKKVYSSIELSYNFLTSDEEKSLFLFCSLFREDENIYFEILLRFGMSLDLFQGVYRLEQVRNRVHTLVENLKSSSLLLDGDYDDTVKMHDVIRDVAIHIAGEAKHMFRVENAIKLQELSKQKKLKDSTTLLMLYDDEDDCELPERLECPQLMLLFSIGRNLSLQHPFFEGMKELQHLQFLGINFQYLPSSISFLQNLQTLWLNCCKLVNIALIGELKNLKVLNLSESDIKELPKEIRQLAHLQVLDLSSCSKLEIIPANVLSNLKRLAELYMEKSFSSWEVEEESTEGGIARVEELDHLSHLTTLNIHIPTAKFMPKALIFEKLVRYKIFIGDSYDWTLDFKNSRTLTLQLDTNLQSEYSNAVKILLKSCEDLYLVKLKGVQNILYKLNSDGFPRLKHLQVKDNAEIQYIINSIGLQCVPFPILESFSLKCMTNLEKIWHGQFAVGSFHNLRKVRVEKCDNLKFVFSSSMAGCFPQLQEMVIIECKVMSTIIATEREDETEIIDDTKDMIEFTQLRSLTLQGLPNLLCFHSDVDSRLLFNKKVAVPNLETMVIRGIDNLRTIGLDKLAPNSFCQLKEIRVTDCENLMTIFPSNIESILQSQETVKVTEIKGTNFIETDDVVAAQLKLKNVRNMNPQGILLTFQNLHTITVENCRSLKSLFPASLVKHLTQLERLKIVNCGMEDIVTKAEGLEIVPKFVFPSLNSLQLQNLPELKSFYLGKHTSKWPSLKKLEIENCGEVKIFALDSLSFQETPGQGHHGVSFEQPLFLIEKISFQNLTTLIVGSCDSLKCLLSSSMARSLVQLQDLTIFKCKLMEEIGVTEESDEEKRIDNILFPKLESLDLRDLPKLMRFCLGNLIEFPSLKNLKITDCPKLKTFVSNSLSSNLIVNKELEEMNNCVTQSLFNEKVAVPNLETMEIKGNDNLRMIWDDKLAPNSFCQLKKIRVTDCENLMNIFPSNIESILQSQETVKVTEIKGTNVIETGDIVAAQLKLKNVWNMNPQGILLTFQNLRAVTVGNCRSLKSLFLASVAKHLTQLVRLQIFNCGVEYIVAKAEGLETEPKCFFPSLNCLELRNLPELKSFYLGEHTSEWPSLKKLKIENCGKLKIFANSDSLSFQETQGQGQHGVSFEQPLFLIEKASFAELEELTLRRNFSMNELPGGTLARVKELYLDEIPELVHLSKEDLLADPYFQNMEVLNVSKCNKLKNLMSSSISFENLTRLSVRNCHGLLNLITSPKSLVQLMKMDIANCKNITEIVANKGDDELLFSKLKFLALRGLPSLTSFYLGNCNIKFPSLKGVIVNGCPELKIFSPGIVTTPKLQRLELSKKYQARQTWEADVVVTPKKELEEVDLNAIVKTFREDNFSKSEDQTFKVNTSSDEDDSEVKPWLFYDYESKMYV